LLVELQHLIEALRRDEYARPLALRILVDPRRPCAGSDRMHRGAARACAPDDFGDFGGRAGHDAKARWAAEVRQRLDEIDADGSDKLVVQAHR
jgi:hypothetical protein